MLLPSCGKRRCRSQSFSAKDCQLHPVVMEAWRNLFDEGRWWWGGGRRPTSGTRMQLRTTKMEVGAVSKYTNSKRATHNCHFIEHIKLQSNAPVPEGRSPRKGGYHGRMPASSRRRGRRCRNTAARRGGGVRRAAGTSRAHGRGGFGKSYGVNVPSGGGGSKVRPCSGWEWGRGSIRPRNSAPTGVTGSIPFLGFPLGS